jgi:hypothetical protein
LALAKGFLYAFALAFSAGSHDLPLLAHPTVPGWSLAESKPSHEALSMADPWHLSGALQASARSTSALRRTTYDIRPLELRHCHATRITTVMQTLAPLVPCPFPNKLEKLANGRALV